MRLIPSALVLASLGLCAPLNIETSLEALPPLKLRSANEAHVAIETLEARAPRCVTRAIQTFRLNDSQAVLAYITLTGISAEAICDHYHEPDCVFWVRLITSGLNFIFAIASNRGQTEGVVAESPDNSAESFARRGLPDQGDASTLTRTLFELGIEHRSVEAVDVSSLPHYKRDSSEPELTHRSIVRGVTMANNTHDIAYNKYSNGGHVIHLGGPNEPLQTGPSLETNKRAGFGQAGFKISAHTTKSSGLSSEDIGKVSSHIGDDWAHRATYNGISEYIGYVQTGKEIDFIYRIIPEIRGFGMNYETVGTCGPMMAPQICQSMFC